MLCPGLSKADSIELWLTGLKKKGLSQLKYAPKAQNREQKHWQEESVNFKKKIQVVTMNSFFVTVNEMQL